MIYGNQNAINAVPVAKTYSASNSSTVAVTFNAATRLIQVTAVTAPILVAWGTAAASTSNFHVLVSPNSSLFLTIPYKTDGTLYTAANFIEAAVNSILAVCEY